MYSIYVLNCLKRIVREGGWRSRDEVRKDLEKLHEHGIDYSQEGWWIFNNKRKELNVDERKALIWFLLENNRIWRSGHDLPEDLKEENTKDISEVEGR